MSKSHDTPLFSCRNVHVHVGEAGYQVRTVTVDYFSTVTDCLVIRWADSDDTVSFDDHRLGFQYPFKVHGDDVHVDKSSL